MQTEQTIQARAQGRVARAGLVKVSRALFRRQFGSVAEKGFFGHGRKAG
jgi:hypothetical protein